MNLIRGSIERPVAVIAAVLMVIMFGIVALQYIPIQLAPDVNRPVITVTTNWPGAAPARWSARCSIARGRAARHRGIGRHHRPGRNRAGTGIAGIRRRHGYGQGAATGRQPPGPGQRLPGRGARATFDTAGSEDNAIAWLVLRARTAIPAPCHLWRFRRGHHQRADRTGQRRRQYARLRRRRARGAGDRRSERLAAYELTVPSMVNALRAANASISAGAVEEGKRRYVVRTEGDLNGLEAIRQVVVRSDSDGASGRVSRVTAGDVAEVTYAVKDPISALRINGERGLAHPVYRETGANVIETMEGVRTAIEEINETYLEDADLYLTQVYDETTYINSALELVRQNIWVGGSLAAILLLTFLRSGAATLVVSLAIPVSVVGSFVAMAALGRSINVISLAGLAFSVGMVVDAAIVVLENIYRMRQQGLPVAEAAYRGAQQVWGAILVSALTTVMVFIPILIMELEVGQLFRDIAVAISVSVLLSLLVAVTVIPALASRLLGGNIQTIAQARKLPVIDHFGRGFVRVVMAVTRLAVRSKAFALAMVVVLTGLCSAVTVVMLPKLDYLPDGNRNLVIGFLLPPPGYNLDTMTKIASRLEDATRPLWSSDDGPSATEDGRATMSRFFFVAFRANVIIGAAAVDPGRAGELIPPLRQAAASEPAPSAFPPNLFVRAWHRR